MANFNQPLADISEFLREQQGKSQVTQQQDGNHQSESGHKVNVHGLPQLLAGLDVEKGHAEENGCEKQH
jgi:hypothetical protein